MKKLLSRFNTMWIISLFFIVFSSIENLNASSINTHEDLEEIQAISIVLGSNLSYYHQENQEEDIPSLQQDSQLITSHYKPPADHNQIALYAYKKAKREIINAIAADNLRCQIIDETSQAQNVLQPKLLGDRRKQVNDTSLWPYSTCGHMLMRFPNSNESRLGTGVLIGPNHVLTAGHNLFDDERGGWAKEIVFVPGQNEDKYPFGDAKGNILVCPKFWVESADEDYDFGIFILDEPLGYFAGWSAIMCAPDSSLDKHIVSVTGYPGDKGRKGYFSTQMWTMENKLGYIGNKDTLFYDIDTHGGQSGSPIWGEWKNAEGYFIVGVHTRSASPNFPEEGNRGVRLTYPKFKFILENLIKHQIIPESVDDPHLRLYNSYRERAREDKDNDSNAQYQLGRIYYYGDGKQIQINAENDKEAFKWFEKSAGQNHIGALCALGKCYEEGRGVGKNEKKAFEFYGQAIKLVYQNTAEAERCIGLCYLNGKGTKRSEENAIDHLEEAAKADDPEAHFLLGNYYFERDISKGIMHYKKAAKQGFIRSQFILSQIYMVGYEGFPQDYLRGFKWLKIAADRGHPDAQLMMGLTYQNGMEGFPLGLGELPIDKSKGSEYLQKSADQENQTSQYILGKQYASDALIGELMGEQVIKDDKKLGWLEKSATKGYRDAQIALSNLSFEGKLVPQDNAKGMKYIEMAAKDGHIECQLSLGVSYLKGEGIVQNEKKGFKWIKKAAKKGNATAQYILSSLYLNGRGVEIDLQKGVKWLERAANQGYHLAQNDMGYIYLKGKIVPRNTAIALDWLKKASNENSFSWIGKIYLYGWGVDQDYKQALHYFKKAADQDNATAFYCLGFMLQRGLGSEKNSEDACKWYLKAFHKYQKEAESDVYNQTNLALCYLRGEGIAQDFTLAYSYFYKAALKDERTAQAYVGWMYLQSLGVSQDHNQALKWIKLSADYENEIGLYFLGLMYSMGEGIEQDSKKAIELLYKAAQYWEADAEYFLGWIYQQGRGVSQDFKRAKEWQNLGEQHYASHAFYAIGRIYELGLGEKKDLNIAREWYKKAIDRGFVA